MARLACIAHLLVRSAVKSQSGPGYCFFREVLRYMDTSDLPANLVSGLPLGLETVCDRHELATGLEHALARNSCSRLPYRDLSCVSACSSLRGKSLVTESGCKCVNEILPSHAFCCCVFSLVRDTDFV